MNTAWVLLCVAPAVAVWLLGLAMSAQWVTDGWARILWLVGVVALYVSGFLMGVVSW